MRKYVPAEEHNVAAEYFFTSDVQLGDKRGFRLVVSLMEDKLQKCKVQTKEELCKEGSGSLSYVAFVHQQLMLV